MLPLYSTGTPVTAALCPTHATFLPRADAIPTTHARLLPAWCSPLNSICPSVLHLELILLSLPRLTPPQDRAFVLFTQHSFHQYLVPNSTQEVLSPVF